jgi:hypothetical protein
MAEKCCFESRRSSDEGRKTMNKFNSKKLCKDVEDSRVTLSGIEAYGTHP